MQRRSRDFAVGAPDSQIDGKGMGIKARDEEGAIGCSACHAWIHSSGPTREEKRRAFEAARDRTRSLLRNLKYINRGSMFRLSLVSVERLQGVHPKLIEIVRKAAEISDVEFRVMEGVRDRERQGSPPRRRIVEPRIAAHHRARGRRRAHRAGHGPMGLAALREDRRGLQESGQSDRRVDRVGRGLEEEPGRAALSAPGERLSCRGLDVTTSRISLTKQIAEVRRTFNALPAQIMQPAIASALNKVAAQGRTQAVRQMKATYALPASALRSAIFVNRATRNALTATLKAAGSPLPLILFRARQTRKGVTYEIKRGIACYSRTPLSRQ